MTLGNVLTLQDIARKVIDTFVQRRETLRSKTNFSINFQIECHHLPILGDLWEGYFWDYGSRGGGDSNGIKSRNFQCLSVQGRCVEIYSSLS